MYNLLLQVLNPKTWNDVVQGKLSLQNYFIVCFQCIKSNYGGIIYLHAIIKLYKITVTLDLTAHETNERRTESRIDPKMSRVTRVCLAFRQFDIQYSWGFCNRAYRLRERIPTAHLEDFVTGLIGLEKEFRWDIKRIFLHS